MEPGCRVVSTNGYRDSCVTYVSFDAEVAATSYASTWSACNSDPTRNTREQEVAGGQERSAFQQVASEFPGKPSLSNFC